MKKTTDMLSLCKAYQSLRGGVIRVWLSPLATVEDPGLAPEGLPGEPPPDGDSGGLLPDGRLNDVPPC